MGKARQNPGVSENRGLISMTFQKRHTFTWKKKPNTKVNYSTTARKNLQMQNWYHQTNTAHNKATSVINK